METTGNTSLREQALQAIRESEQRFAMAYAERSGKDLQDRQQRLASTVRKWVGREVEFESVEGEDFYAWVLAEVENLVFGTYGNEGVYLLARCACGQWVKLQQHQCGSGLLEIGMALAKQEQEPARCYECQEKADAEKQRPATPEAQALAFFGREGGAFREAHLYVGLSGIWDETASLRGMVRLHPTQPVVEIWQGGSANWVSLSRGVEARFVTDQEQEGRTTDA